MSSENRQALYDQICSVLDEHGLNYERIDELYGVRYGVGGGELPKSFILYAEENRLNVVSRLPFTIPDEKSMAGAIAVAAVNNRLGDGCFEYNIATGELFFRLSYNVGNSVLGETIFYHMIRYSNDVVEQYDDSFLMFAKGKIELSAFLEKFAKE